MKLLTLTVLTALLGAFQVIFPLHVESFEVNFTDSVEPIPESTPPISLAPPTSSEVVRRVLETDNPSFIEDDITSVSFYGRSGKKQAMQSLYSASVAEGRIILTKYFKISELELDLLKLMPGATKLTSVKVAETIVNFEPPNKISKYLKTGNPSSSFKSIISVYLRDSKLSAKMFIKRAEGAKKEFYQLNPGWFGENSDTGDSYRDAKNKFVYLPLGDISFADRVVSHELGNPKGSHAEGAVGIPDMSTVRFNKADARICNIGTRGVLTLEFTDNVIVDVNGPDLYVFEMGQIEPTNLEISKDGNNWINVGKVTGGTAKVDIKDFVKKGDIFKYVRLTDLNMPSGLPGADVDAVAAIGGGVRLNLNSAVLFETGQFELKQAAVSELENLIRAIQKFSSAAVLIEGHTDDVGDPERNQTLSTKRAEKVSEYLKEKLSNKYTLDIRGYGESQPIVPNDNDSNRQKNRRVEILVIPLK